MNIRLGTLGLIAALVFSAQVRAQDEEGGGGEESGASASSAKSRLGKSYYFAPQLNFVKSADGRTTDDGYGLSFSLGRSMTSGLNLELIGSYARLPDNASDADVWGVGLGAQVFPFSFAPDLYIPLYLQRGQVNDHPGLIPNYSTTLFDVGLGYLIGIGQSGLALKAEARYRIDAHGRESAGDGDTRKQFYDGVAGLGMIIPFGSAAPAAPAPEAEAPPAEEPPAEVTPVAAADSDNDGVLDDADQCPGTPAGAIVDEKGCEKDSDGDGVVDRLDKCPDTPAGTAVNEEGCPAAPPAPACEAPAPGQPIDLNGCKTGDAIVLKGVNFDLDSARLTLNAKSILNGVADALLAMPNMKAEVGGHTSSDGSDSHNQSLSDRRATSVKEYLESRGVTADRLTAKGYGEGSPVADNATQEGREINRRVELKVMDDGRGAAAPATEAPAAEAAPATEAPAAEAAPAAELAPTEAAPSDAPAEEAPAAEAPAGEEAPAEAPAEAAATEEAPAAEAPAEAAPAGEAPAAETPPEVENATPAE